MELQPERFSTVPLFESLTFKEIAELLKLSHDVVATRGQEIIREGDIPSGFYVVGAGAFEVRKKGETLARLEEFSYFGEMSLVSNDARSASVICVEDGRLKKFPIDPFNQMFDNGDRTAYKVLRNMARILARRLAKLGERFVS